VVGIAVCHEGENGYWDPFLWCDGDAETAVGREMYGWPQRMADLSVTEPNPLTGWRVGDLATGKISRFHDPVMSLSASIDREGDLSLELPRFSIFYTERVLPDPASGVITRELFASTMAEVAVADQFSGTATLTLQAPELQALQPKRVVGGKINTVAWTKGSARHVANREHAGSNPC
jgi:acetoacetate decarboxylase